MMYSSLPLFESQVIEKIDSGELNFALNLIIKFASSIAGDSRATANVLGSATLDALCQRSSGRSVKFEHPYLYAYAELVPKILAVTGGVHIHIGKLPPRLIDTINQGLKTQEIDPKRFIHILNVRSIWKTMHEQRVDVYLDSFPIGGARTVIEVMGSGTPIIGHQNYRSCAFSTINIVYPEAFNWRTPDELLNYLQILTPEVLLMQATCSRKHYEFYHRPNILRQQLMLIGLREDGLLPPPLKNYLRDDLQAFLDQIDLNNLSLRIRLQQAQATIKATTTRMLSSEFWKLQIQKQRFKLKKFLRLVNDV